VSQCSVCGADKECRPYTRDGSMICFDCATAPDRIAQTAAAFGAQLNACGDIAVVHSDSEAGPFPYSKVRS
jgi:recombinational DNA repair protein (RecF pathway)